MDLKKILSETEKIAERHFCQWQQDVGAIDILKLLIAQEEKETSKEQ